MSERIFVFSGCYHFGNNAGVFQDAVFVGLALKLPMQVIWIDSADTVEIHIQTHDIETWGNWQGHPVLVNGTEVGRLKDPADTLGQSEVFMISIDTNAFQQLVGGTTGKITFEIRLEQQPAHPTLLDDFVLMRVETAKMAWRLGW